MRGNRKAVRAPAAAAAALGIAAAGILWFGERAAGAAGRETRSAALEQVRVRAGAEAAAAAVRLREAMESTRAGDLGSAPFPVEPALVPWLPEEAPDRESLVAALASGDPGDPDRERLRRDIEEGRLAGVSPSERLLAHRALGGDAGRVGALAAAAALADAEDARGAAVLAGDRIAWDLGSTGGGMRVALAPRDAVLAALLPGVREGLLGPVAAGAGTRLPAPFPPMDVAPTPAALAAAEGDAGRAALAQRLPAAALAAVLLAAGALLAANARARARLEARRDAFLCAVTHELKTPVANVLLYAETIREHGASDPGRVAGFAGTIASEALRLQARIQDVLDVASGRREVAPGSGFAPGEEARAAAREMEGAAAARGMRIEVDAGPADLRAAGEASLFRRALAAVLENAVKFAGRGAVRVAVGREDGAPVVAVEDEGPGIPAAERERVFEAFVRLGDERTRREPGTGLGLALARRCMEECGGTARAAEARGGGARILLVMKEAGGAHDPAR